MQSAFELQQLGIEGFTHASRSGSQTFDVQTMPSSQVGGVPFTQSPVEPSQVSKPLQKTPSSQTFGVPAQAPSAQVSSSVHGFRSSHEAVLFAYSQSPVVGLHESSVQTLWSSQSRCEPGTQLPPEHWSPIVHAF